MCTARLSHGEFHLHWLYKFYDPNTKHTVISLNSYFLILNPLLDEDTLPSLLTSPLLQRPRFKGDTPASPPTMPSALSQDIQLDHLIAPVSLTIPLHMSTSLPALSFLSHTFHSYPINPIPFTSAPYTSHIIISTPLHAVQPAPQPQAVAIVVLLSPLFRDMCS